MQSPAAPAVANSIMPRCGGSIQPKQALVGKTVKGGDPPVLGLCPGLAGTERRVSRPLEAGDA